MGKNEKGLGEVAAFSKKLQANSVHNIVAPVSTLSKLEEHSKHQVLDPLRKKK